MAGCDCNRRGFIKGAGAALGVTAAAGAGLTAYAMKKTWDPLPSVVAAGKTTVDISGMEEGQLSQVEFRGKPVFILKKSSDMENNDNRDVVVEGSRFTVVIGICTHLGCIPAYLPDAKMFKCACHGGEFNSSGVNTFGPPPRPMDIPPFKVDGQSIVLGEEGPEYKKMMATA
jgi:ubiquinol-cytochrome c reductase iron-sulfur subunit